MSLNTNAREITFICYPKNFAPSTNDCLEIAKPHFRSFCLKFRQMCITGGHSCSRNLTILDPLINTLRTA